jgi:lipoprotein-releasing system ATP-binding protein
MNDDGSLRGIQLQAMGLAKVFNKGPVRLELFRNLDLVIRQRERVAVVGASGVGKSTLLHILGTLERPTEGKVLYA